MIKIKGTSFTTGQVKIFIMSDNDYKNRLTESFIKFNAKPLYSHKNKK